jgi:hypothetical protein
VAFAWAHSERRHASVRKKRRRLQQITDAGANALATGTFLGLGFPSCGTFLGGDP